MRNMWNLGFCPFFYERHMLRHAYIVFKEAVMNKPIIVTSLSAALAALSIIPSQEASAAIETVKNDEISNDRDLSTNSLKGNIEFNIGTNLFGLTVKQATDGTLIAQHASHSSHSSHRSHSSSRY